MTERGVVLKLDGGRAQVAFDVHAKCVKCKYCAPMRDGMRVTALAINGIGANVGDIVEVDMRARAKLLLSLLYLIPLALVAVGLGVGSLLSYVEMAIFSCAGLLVGLAIAIPVDVVVCKKKLFPKIACFAEPDPDASAIAPKANGKNETEPKTDIKTDRKTDDKAEDKVNDKTDDAKGA